MHTPLPPVGVQQEVADRLHTVEMVSWSCRSRILCRGKPHAVCQEQGVDRPKLPHSSGAPEGRVRTGHTEVRSSYVLLSQIRWTRRGPVKCVPAMKRMTGPKLGAAKAPVKKRPGTLDSRW